MQPRLPLPDLNLGPQAPGCSDEDTQVSLGVPQWTTVLGSLSLFHLWKYHLWRHWNLCWD